MKRAFLEHLEVNNSAGLEAVWSRARTDDRAAIIEALRATPGTSEAHLFLRALVDLLGPGDELHRAVQTGIDALSDLASTGSSDRVQRLAQWARAGAVREALLTTAAQRGAAASNDLVEWLASAEDDALADALIPVFLAAVEQRDGARLQHLVDLSVRNRRLEAVHARYRALRAQSSAEWQAFRVGLGLHQSPPFSATCTFRAGEPALVLTIDPRRLNWFTFVWEPFMCDSTRRPVEGLAFDATGPLVELPSRVHAAMRSLGLKGRRRLQTSAAEATGARLAAWLAPPGR
jgi:hypothetical protein